MKVSLIIVTVFKSSIISNRKSVLVCALWVLSTVEFCFSKTRSIGKVINCVNRSFINDETLTWLGRCRKIFCFSSLASTIFARMLLIIELWKYPLNAIGYSLKKIESNNHTKNWTTINKSTAITIIENIGVHAMPCLLPRVAQRG